MVVNLLLRGDWVYLFFEGRVSRDGELGTMRRGVVKLLCDVEIVGGMLLMVLLFWYFGMFDVKLYG